MPVTRTIIGLESDANEPQLSNCGHKILLLLLIVLNSSPQTKKQDSRKYVQQKPVKNRTSNPTQALPSKPQSTREQQEQQIHPRNSQG
jgi:hypothetical protein